MKNIFLIFAILIASSAYGSHTVVTTATEINNGNWVAGDTIIMKNGTWTDQSISFTGIGNSEQPIVLIAETAGSVILNGNSKLGFSGKYIEVNGLYFKNGTLSGSDVISFRRSSSDLAENCRLTNTTIENYNPAVNTVDNKWVSLYGKNNKVDHCSFINKNNSGTLLVVWLTSGVTVNHIISDNYFGYRNSNLDSTGSELNGQEIIRIGDSSTSMTTANVTVSGNFFEHCNGEIEIISNKSCGNLYSNNLFLESHGMLTLRHGNNCTVDGNYFFGNGISESGGVRIIGENHKVYNNYFDKLRGTSYRAAICVVRGKENSAANEYFQVKNAIIEFNTMVDCSQAFNINYNSSSSLTMPPIGTTISNNHVYNTSSSNYNVIINTVSLATMDVSWSNNLMNQGRYANFTYSPSEITTNEDAKMELAGTTINMYEPGFGSALANYTTSENNDVIKDIRGRDRGTAKLPGCSQLTGTISKAMPVKTEVGAGFYNDSSTGFRQTLSSDDIKIYSIGNQLITHCSVPGNLYVYDFLGKMIIQNPMTEGATILNIPQKGNYIVVFKSVSGLSARSKIIVN